MDNQELPEAVPNDWSYRETRQLALHKAHDLAQLRGLVSATSDEILADAQKYYNWLTGDDVADSKKGTQA